MIVYVLSHQHDGLIGVYSSMEKAEIAQSKADEYCKMITPIIEEVEVDTLYLYHVSFKDSDKGKIEKI